MARVKNLALLALCLCLASILSLRAESKEDIFGEYLKRPRLVKVSLYHRSNRKWLQSLDVRPNSSPQSVLEQLERVRSEESLDDIQSENYNLLISLSKKDAHCPARLVDFVLSIYAQLESPKQDALADYMVFFGREKFALCASVAERAIMLEPKSEYAIDEFFRLRLGLPEESRDSAIVDALKKTRLKFQLSFYECQDLSKRFGTMLNIINLANALGAHDHELEARAEKLTEYYRRCPEHR